MAENTSTVSTSDITNEDALRTIVRSMLKCMQAGVQQASFDTTYTGIITKVNFDENTKPTDKTYNNYAVKYNGVERNFYIKDGITHKVGEAVRVHVPKNNSTSRYVEAMNNTNGSHPYHIEYNDDDDTITELWCDDETAIANYFEKQEPINEDKITQRVYTLVVENKGTENEEVTQMIFPDGSKMDIKGF